MIGPALAKAAGSGVAKVAGWGVKSLLEERRRKRIRALVHSKGRADQLQALADLSSEQTSLLVGFCESLELEKFATALSSAHLVEGSGRTADKLLASIKGEFRESLCMWMGTEVDDLAVKAVWDALSESVINSVAPVAGRGKLAPAIEAELVGTVASMAAASVRNVELLRSLNTIEDIRIFESQLKSQIAALHGTMRLPHAGTTRQVPYDSLFVDPAVTIAAKEKDHSRPEDSRVQVPELILGSLRAVILGDPGGGKSTLSRKLMFDLADDRIEQLQGRVPFYVELRDYASSVRGTSRQTLIEYLEGVCKSPYNLSVPASAIEYMLLNNRAVVILDGLDELLDVSLRRDVVQAVEGFAHLYPNCPMLVTSRRVGYVDAALNEGMFTHASLSEFSFEQVQLYVNRWFALDESIESSRRHQLASAFIRDSHFVADLRVNPLMLSLMCGIYASENYIPRNRPDVYEKCALLLFESWDKQRGILPALSFDAHVQSALRALALHMYEAESSDSPAGDDIVGASSREGVGRREITLFLQRYLREKRFDNDEDAESAAVEFLEFCKGRAWVLTDVGAETYGFTHRTFLEYFAASQLVRLHPSAESLYSKLRNDIGMGMSDVVAQLALQLLGRAVEDGADDFLALVVNDASGVQPEYFNKVSFASRSLHFIVPRPQVLKDICNAVVRFRNDHESLDPFGDLSPTASLFRSSQENMPRISMALRERLSQLFSSDEEIDEGLLQLAFLDAKNAGPFWHQWTLENLDIFDSVLVRMRKNYFWVAVMEYEKSRIGLEELFELHGVGSLYDFRINGSSETPPFIYRLLVHARDGGYEGLIAFVPRKRAQEIKCDLLELLPSTSKPWMRWKADYGTSAMAIAKRGGTRHKSAIRTLLALPLLEVLKGKPSRDLPEDLIELIEIREGRMVQPILHAESEELLEGSTAAHDLVRAWTSAEVSLVRNKPRKRQSIK